MSTPLFEMSADIDITELRAVYTTYLFKRKRTLSILSVIVGALLLLGSTVRFFLIFPFGQRPFSVLWYAHGGPATLFFFLLGAFLLCFPFHWIHRAAKVVYKKRIDAGMPLRSKRKIYPGGVESINELGSAYITWDEIEHAYRYKSYIILNYENHVFSLDLRDITVGREEDLLEFLQRKVPFK